MQNKGTSPEGRMITSALTGPLTGPPAAGAPCDCSLQRFCRFAALAACMPSQLHAHPNQERFGAWPLEERQTGQPPCVAATMLTHVLPLRSWHACIPSDSPASAPAHPKLTHPVAASHCGHWQAYTAGCTSLQVLQFEQGRDQQASFTLDRCSGHAASCTAQHEYMLPNIFSF